MSSLPLPGRKRREGLGTRLCQKKKRSGSKKEKLRFRWTVLPGLTIMKFWGFPSEKLPKFNQNETEKRQRPNPSKMSPLVDFFYILVPLGGLEFVLKMEIFTLIFC